MFGNFFKSKKQPKNEIIPLKSVLLFDEDFKAKFKFYKGKWLADESGVIYVLNFYHENEGVVESLDFNMADEESNKPLTVSISGEQLIEFTANNWGIIREWHERQERFKRSLSSFKFVIKRVEGYKTKKERRASNLKK